jgi:hypothetical protein
MEDKQWIREQLRFATCLENMLNESNIEWTKELDFASLYDYYEDEFEDMEDDEEF